MGLGREKTPARRDILLPRIHHPIPIRRTPVGTALAILDRSTIIPIPILTAPIRRVTVTFLPW